MKIVKFLLVTMMLFPAISMATPILDQVNDTSSSWAIAAPTPSSDAGQSFTIGLSGVLHSIELLGWNQATAYPASRNHTLSIYHLGTEYDYDNEIASTTQTADSYLEQWFNFDFSDFNIFVEAGDELLMLWTTAGEFRWRHNSYAYGQGDRFIRNSYYPEGILVQNQDQIFRTYITPVPEPATLILFGIGLVGLAGNRIRRKK